MSDQPTPVDVYASLKLLMHGLKEAEATAAAEADDFRRSTRAKQLETDYGLVALTRRKPTIVVDDAALLHWAREHAPHVITETISTPAKRALLAGWEIAGDDVIDPDTGEVVEFASVKPGGESLMVRLSPEAKAFAADVLTSRAADLTQGFNRLLASAKPAEIEQS